MEKISNLLQNRRFQIIVLILCFIFSAICFILFISQIYSFSTQNNIPQNSPIVQNNSNPPQQPPAQDDFFRGIPKGSPLMLLVFLFGFMITFLAGMVIYDQINKKEKNEIKLKVVSKLLLPEERLFIELLEKNGGELTQKELSLKSNLNKLKVSRVIKRLESLNLVSKQPYGMTNHIKLKSEN